MLTANGLLKDYLNWPYPQQVFRIERRFLRIRDGELMEEVKHGVTSMTTTKASPERLLELKVPTGALRTVCIIAGMRPFGKIAVV